MAALVIWLHGAIGPYWLAPNNDPSFLYLFNGLLIAAGGYPLDIYHPGTTLQLLVALVIKMMSPFAAKQELVYYVVGSAEQHLELVWTLLLSIYIAGLAFSGYWFAQRFKSIRLGLWFQVLSCLLPCWFMWQCPEAQYFTNVNSEMVLVALMPFYLVSLCHLAIQEKVSIWSVLQVAGLSAIILVTKIAFFPLIILPIALMRSVRNAAIYIVSGIVFSGLFMWPMWRRMKDFVNWIRLLIFKPGSLGGEDPISLVDRIVPLVLNYWPLFVIAIIGLGIGLFSYYRHRKGPGLQRLDTSLNILLLFSALTIFFDLAFIAKQAQGHYLFCAVGLAALIMFLLIRQVCKDQGAFLKADMIGMGVCMVLVLSMIVVRQQAYASTAQELLEFKARSDEVAQGCVLADAYPASSPEFAVYFGHRSYVDEDPFDDNKLMYYLTCFRTKLVKFFPGHYFYDDWMLSFYEFGRRRERVPAPDMVDIIKSRGCLYIRTGEVLNKPWLRLQEVLTSKNGQERLYKLVAMYEIISK